MIISLSFLLKMKNVSAKVVDEIKKHISCPIIFFFENPAIFEIMWKNIVQPGRPQMTIWRMHFSCWITKATNTHSAIYNNYFFSSATMAA